MEYSFSTQYCPSEAPRSKSFRCNGILNRKGAILAKNLTVSKFQKTFLADCKIHFCFEKLSGKTTTITQQQIIRHSISQIFSLSYQQNPLNQWFLLFIQHSISWNYFWQMKSWVLSSFSYRTFENFAVFVYNLALIDLFRSVIFLLFDMCWADREQSWLILKIFEFSWKNYKEFQNFWLIRGDSQENQNAQKIIRLVLIIWGWGNRNWSQN